MNDISDEILAFQNATSGASFKQNLMTLLTQLNDNVEDVSSITFDDFYNGCFFRGEELGSGSTFAEASTQEQRDAINDGSFENLYIGDYWTIDNKIFRIADFNYFKRVGDTDFTTNHLVIVPDNSLLNAKMNSTDTATGAYAGSEMYSDAEGGLAQAKTLINSLFGNYIVSHRIYLPNAISSDGAESAGAWYDSTVDLMSEIMVYGTKIRCKNNAGTFLPTSEKTQLALFRLNPLMINNRANYWLRDVVSSTAFARVVNSGSANGNGASLSYGVRPFFTIKGTN